MIQNLFEPTVTAFNYAVFLAAKASASIGLFKQFVLFGALYRFYACKNLELFARVDFRTLLTPHDETDGGSRFKSFRFSDKLKCSPVKDYLTAFFFSLAKRIFC